MIHPVDLDTVVFRGAVVVLVRKIAEGPVTFGDGAGSPDRGTAWTVRVLRKFRGIDPVEVGQTFEVDFSSYLVDVHDGRRAPRIEPEMFLLLAPTVDGSRSARFPWELLEARVFIGGRAFALRDSLGWGPLPAERPPGSLVAHDRASFEVEMARVVARTDAVKQLLAAPPSPWRTAHLVSRAREGRARHALGEDHVGGRILDELGRAGEIDALLDARAGAPRAHTRGLLVGAELLAEKALHATTLERRLAAIALLAEERVIVTERPAHAAQIVRLLRDPLFQIRRAAATLPLLGDGAPRTLSDAIVARVAVEPDPLVRLALYEKAIELGRKRDLRRAVQTPIFAATAKGEGENEEFPDAEATVRWTTEDDHEQLSSAVVELRDGDRVVHTEDVTNRTSSWPGTAVVPLVFASPVEARAYDVTIAIKVTGARGFERRMGVGPVRVTQRDSYFPAETSEVAVDVVPVASATKPAQSAPLDPRALGLVGLELVLVVVGFVARRPRPGAPPPTQPTRDPRRLLSR